MKISSIASTFLFSGFLSSPSSSATANNPFEMASPVLDCDPCINRSNYKIQAIYHGDKDDPFWQPVERAAMQAGKDLGVDINVKLYDNFDPAAMAADIRRVARIASVKDDRPDALIVTIPDDTVAEAVLQAVEAGIPVFGLNSGYKVAKDLGLKAFVAQDEYLAGKAAAEEMLRLTNNTIRANGALFVNHEAGNSGLTDRKQGFEEVIEGATGALVTEFILDSKKTDAAILQELDVVMEGCPFDVVQLAGLRVNEIQDFELILSKCPNTKLGTFDVSKNVYEDIVHDRLAFGISQQEYLQGVLPVHLATTYVTTGKLPAPPLGDNEGVYLSGPSVINKENVPSDTMQSCADEGFPICPNDDESASFPTTESACGCIDRSTLRFGGVVHGVTTDSFWDPVFAAAEQVAADMGVELIMQRLEPPFPGQSDEVITRNMATNIRHLCTRENVDGIFVSIPNEDSILMDAIKTCQELYIPVISINSGAEVSQQLGLMHHIGQLEYEAGYAAGKRMISSGVDINKGWCVNHEPENDGIAQRCTGFAAALNETEVKYMGEIDVPRDNHALYTLQVEDVIKDPTGSWKGYGLLLAGQDHITPAVSLLDSHPDVTMGTFDTSEEIFAALDAKQLSFGIDQQAYLQGYMPIPLLTYFANSRQKLQNKVLESGPAFVTSSPSDAAVTCEMTNFEVCPAEEASTNDKVTAVPDPQGYPILQEPGDESHDKGDNSKKNVGPIVGGIVGGLVAVLSLLAFAAAAFKVDSYCSRRREGIESSTNDNKEGGASETEQVDFETPEQPPSNRSMVSMV